MPSPLDLWLIAALGFLGSFGHCVGMCGPVTAAFALSHQRQSEPGQSDPDSSTQARSVRSHLWFHMLLNLGRLLSYALVGAGIGALGSVVFAGGQMAGVGSALRRSIALLTGVMLIWFGLTQASPGFLPALPFLNPAQRLHERLNLAMSAVSSQSAARLTPLLLGLLWGLIPCGFLYAGQLRAAETQSWVGGAAIMLAFGLGTLPAMLATGVTTSLLSRDRRSQLFRCGGWLTVIIGTLLLVRTGDTMSDYSGHAALVCLILALIARPISRFWSAPLRYRRGLGVGAFALSCLHLLHMASHTWNWQLQAIQFMLPAHQVGVWLGMIALLLMLPGALTSFDRAQKALGNRWRKLHLLSVPALLLAAGHTILVGSQYWGAVVTWQNQGRVAGLLTAVGLVFAVRSRSIWSLLSVKKHYAPPQSHPRPVLSGDRDCCQSDLPRAQSDD
ncbi:sulfite exporter TauE/SafE family protein [Leptolyngbya sp. BC1307]|uniref:urease accessory protein UreH domain-containing protein n=1 Tax=Leptolyngbya sp. BC1307 TaxID=2029589 RepID=UPI000EFD42AD|nr:sulfite exporter TauE/SafE family protein [Leptolyngbya sp. BC1307]